MRQSEFAKTEITPRMRVRYLRHQEEVELVAAPVYKGEQLLVLDNGIKVYRSRIISLKAA